MRPKTTAETAEVPSIETGLEYRKVNGEVRKKVKAAKEEWIKERCRNTEKGEKGVTAENSKEAYNTLKAQDPTISSHHGQQWKADGKHSCSEPMDRALQRAIQLTTPSVTCMLSEKIVTVKFWLHPETRLLQRGKKLLK